MQTGALAELNTLNELIFYIILGKIVIDNFDKIVCLATGGTDRLMKNWQSTSPKSSDIKPLYKCCLLLLLLFSEDV